MKAVLRTLVLSALLATTVLIPVQPAAADVAPTAITETLEAGSTSPSAHAVTVSVPATIPKADVVFALDLTSSMGNQLTSLKSKVTSTIIPQLQTLIADAEFGLISFEDYPNVYSSFAYTARYGASVNSPYRLELPPTSDVSAVQAAINPLTVQFGEDVPESYTRVLYESYADPAIGWRPGARRILVVIGDSLPHDDSLCGGVPTTVCPSGMWIGSGGDPGRDGQMDCLDWDCSSKGDDLDLQTVLAHMRDAEVKLFTIYSPSPVGYWGGFDKVNPERALALWDHWSESTGGDAVQLSDTANLDNLPAAIKTAVEASQATVEELSLRARGAYASWATISAPHLNVATPSASEQFNVRFTPPAGTPEGTYVIPLEAVGDGAVIGVTSATITVDNNETPTVSVADPGPLATPTVVEGNASGGANVALVVTATDAEDGVLSPACREGLNAVAAGGDFYALGVHTVECTATDTKGAVESDSTTFTVVDSTGPVFATGSYGDISVAPTSGAGAQVTYATPTASDAVSGASVTCAPPSGSTFAVGTTVVTCTATDDGGNTTQITFTVSVRYGYGGFLQPVDERPTFNVVRAGGGVPVKFSLDGDQTMNIFTAGYPKSERIVCTSTADTDGVETTVAAGGSSLQYDALTDTYTYVWKTEKAWHGTCRQLVLKFRDGSYARANFDFRR
jgi:hypothetical protein